ncbi:MAG TPA: hypothetical protein VKB76_06430, partial [Ktedonobacterales bacterium]|nr:hypothetical protein [Ktedonobacterales bacterium]
MLEAAHTDLVSHQPEAQHPKSSAIHKYAGRLPHLSRRYQRHSGHCRSPVAFFTSRVRLRIDQLAACQIVMR